MAQSLPLEPIVRHLLGGRTKITVLDAGCGARSLFRYARGARRVGIDISPEQLARNDALAEKIVGDIQTHRFDAERFDLIVCWDVLEHLPRPQEAVRNLVMALKPGGLMLLVSPNVLSLRGLVTKLTPRWAHVWYYRHVIGNPRAGTPGSPPFDSFHRLAMSLPALESLAKALGLDLVYSCLTHIGRPEDVKYPRLMSMWHRANAVVSSLSLGKIATDDEQTLEMILRKPRKSTPPPCQSQSSRRSARPT